MDQSSVSKAQVFLTNRFICIFTGAQILDTAASFLPYNSIIASAKYAVKNIHIQKNRSGSITHNPYAWTPFRSPAFALHLITPI